MAAKSPIHYRQLSVCIGAFPPIRVTSEKRYGWKTLIVFSAGIGNVLLRFNGSGYPLNPSTQPLATESQINAGSTLLEREK